MTDDPTGDGTASSPRDPSASPDPYSGSPFTPTSRAAVPASGTDDAAPEPKHLAAAPTAGRGLLAAFGSTRVKLGALWGSRVISAGLAVALLVGLGYYSATLRDLTDNVASGNVNFHETYSNPPTVVQNGTTTTAAPAPVQKDIDGADQNILVVGNDDRSGMTDQEVRELHVGRDGGSLNTDTMMIVHVPADGSSATLISLPRDSYVSIPGHGMNRLNTAYAYGYMEAKGDENAKKTAGADLLIATVTQLTGLTFDHFIQVTLLGFVRIAQAIGGVTVNLCDNIDGRPYTPLVLSKGQHTLTPVQALEFVRQRHGLNLGDIDRVARQRYFITAAFRQITSAKVLLSPSKLSALVKAVHDSIWVDSNFNVLDFAKQVSKLTANNIVGETIPYVGGITVYFGGVPQSLLQIDPAAVKKFVLNIIDGTSNALAKAKTVAPSTVSVAVVKAQKFNGTVSKSVQTLVNAGFKASSSTGPSDTVVKTTIEYPDGMESQAKTLARYIKGVALDNTNKVDTLTLAIGRDLIRPAAKPFVHKKLKHKAIDSGCTV